MSRPQGTFHREAFNSKAIFIANVDTQYSGRGHYRHHQLPSHLHVARHAAPGHTQPRGFQC